MAIAATTCWFSTLTSTSTSRYSISSQRLFSTSRTPSPLIVSKFTNQNQNQSRRNTFPREPPLSPLQSSLEKEAKSQKFSGRSKGERHKLTDGRSRSNTGRSRSTALNSLGIERKGGKGFMVDTKSQQVNSVTQDAAFLNAVVKVYCTHTEPDYNLPWQKQRQFTSTGSAFMIGDRKLLTNAHCVEYNTQVKVKRRGDDTKYVAKVLAKGVDCDIALLSVEREEFWTGARPLKFGNLPSLQDEVTVVGYPLGGDTISVTKGVVSRIEVTSYGSAELLGIQIDAAINPGNSGGPAFNDQGECIGVAFQGYRSEEVENIGYLIPTAVVAHFLDDYKRNGKYTGFPSLGVLLQRLENPSLRACLKVPSNEGVLVRRVEPTSGALNILKEGDVIVSFDGVDVGNEGTTPFRSTERIAFRYLISQKFTGDEAELGIIRAGAFMKIKVVVKPRLQLVPDYIEEGEPSYLVVGGLVFTPLSEPLIEEEHEDNIGLKLLAKARHSLPRFKGEQIVIVSQVLANEVNIGYEDMCNEQVLKFNGVRIKNIHHLAHLVDSCKDKYLVFEFEDNYLAVLERKASAEALPGLLKDYAIPLERSANLLEQYIDPVGEDEAIEERNFGDTAVSNSEIGFDGLLWV